MQLDDVRQNVVRNYDYRRARLGSACWIPSACRQWQQDGGVGMPSINVGENYTMQGISSNSSDTGLLAESGRVIAKRRNAKHRKAWYLQAALRILDQDRERVAGVWAHKN